MLINYCISGLFIITLLARVFLAWCSAWQKAIEILVFLRLSKVILPLHPLVFYRIEVLKSNKNTDRCQL